MICWVSNKDKWTQAERPTYAWRQVVVPRPSLPSHALEYATAVQRVTLVTAERDGTTSKVTLVTDFKSKLRNTRIITVGQLKAWTGKSEKKEKKEQKIETACKAQTYTNTGLVVSTLNQILLRTSTLLCFYSLHRRKVSLVFWEFISSWAQMMAGPTVSL